MPKLVNRPPLYRHHKARNCACVTLDGKTHYLGPYGSQESRDAYARLVEEWNLRARRPAVPTSRERRRAKMAAQDAAEPVPLTTVELVDRYLAWAETYYTKRDGTPSNENVAIRSAIRPVVKFYATLPARKFRPRHLKAVREQLVSAGWTRATKKGKALSGAYSRKQVNDHVSRIKRMFAWGVESELIPVAVHQRLMRVRSLRRGKTTARDNPPVRAVSDATIELTLPWLSPVVRSLVQFQRWTGCRPGEACAVRPRDVDSSGEVWVYVPAEHKNEHRGHVRKVYLGPRAQLILRPLLLRAADAPCFDPRDSERKRGRAVRLTVRDSYDKDTYGRSVARAIARANKAEAKAAAKEEREPNLIPHWRPNALRHTRASELRREFGIEAARTCLGHSDSSVTAIYAERDERLAEDVARRTG